MSYRISLARHADLPTEQEWTPQAEHWPSIQKRFMTDLQLAAGLAVLASIIFAVGAQLSRLGLRTVDAQNGAFISIAAATVMYWCAAPWLLEPGMWIWPAVAFFIVAGLFRPAVSSAAAMAGTAVLGPTISTTLSSSAPLFGLIAGVVFLNEPLTWPLTLGTLLIIAGVVLLARRPGSSVAQNWPLWALSLPILAAIIRVGAHLVTKIGMEDIPSPYCAGLVGYTASLGVASANLVRRRQNTVRLFATPGARWFLATGVMFGLAVGTLNLALLYGPLSIVAPLVSLEPLAVLLLGVTLFGESNITRRVVIASLIVVAGAILITARG